MLVINGTFVLTERQIYFFMTDEERAEVEAINKEISDSSSSGALSIIDGLISSYGVGTPKMDQLRKLKGKKDRKWKLSDIRDIQRRRYMQQVRKGEREERGVRKEGFFFD
jgi:hypothetical protein